MAHGKPSARAPTQRACGHIAWSYGTLGFSPPPSLPPPSSSASHRKTTLPSQWRTKLGRNSPGGTFLCVSSSVFAEQWLTQSGKKKKAPSRLFLSFHSSQNQTVGCDLFSARSQLGRASALAQWQERDPLVHAAAFIAVVAHLFQRLAFEWLALRILHKTKGEKALIIWRRVNLRALSSEIMQECTRLHLSLYLQWLWCSGNLWARRYCCSPGWSLALRSPAPGASARTRAGCWCHCRSRKLARAWNESEARCRPRPPRPWPARTVPRCLDRCDREQKNKSVNCVLNRNLNVKENGGKLISVDC